MGACLAKAGRPVKNLPSCPVGLAKAIVARFILYVLVGLFCCEMEVKTAIVVVVGGGDDDADENFSAVNDAHRQIARSNSIIATVMSSPWTIWWIPALLASTLQNRTSLRMKRIQPTDHP